MIFLRSQVSDQFYFSICLGNRELKLYLVIEIQEVYIHKIQQIAQVLFREVKVYSNESVDSHIFSVLKDRKDFISNQEKEKS